MENEVKKEVKNKGQVQGQVFIYILSAVVVGLLVLIAYRFFQGSIQQGCDAEEILFKTSIENAFQQYTSYKSVNYASFNAPCDFTKVCFVDTVTLRDKYAELDIPFPPPQEIDRYFFLRDSVTSGVKRNIFLLEADGTLNTHEIYVEQVNVPDPYYLCVDRKAGKFNLKFIGKGKSSEVMQN